jgi:DNA-binding FrmR family transcriptional regulator
MLEEFKSRAIHRSKILEGQLRGLQKMIDEEQYCMDIITQSLAIQKSLGSLNKLIIENHLKTHVKDMMASGEAKKMQAAQEELIKIYELNNNRGSNK